MKPTLLVLLFAPIMNGFAYAQSSAEFGHASGGQIELSAKAPARLSGSFGLGLGSNGYRQATLGGTIMRDRLWFFATAQRDQPRVSTVLPQMPQFAASSTAVLGNRTTLGSFVNARLPSSFLSLRYTGIVSSNSFFTATVSSSGKR